MLKSPNRLALLNTVEDVTDLTGLGPSYVRYLVRAGKLEAVKAGRRVLITGESLAKYIENLPRVEAASGE